MAVHFWSVAEAEKDAKPAADSDLVGYTVAVLTWVLSSGVYIVVKWAIAEMPPWTLCFWRVFIACLVLLPLVTRHLAAMGELLRRRWLELLVTGGIGFAITQGLMYLALEHATAINVGLIFAMMPIFSLVLAHIVLGEAMGPWQIIGSAIAFAGMVVIVVKGSLAALLSFAFSPGEMLALVAALLFPVYSVLLKRAKFELPRLPVLVLLLGAGAVVALPFFLWELWQGEHANLHMKGLLALAYAAIPGGAVMYLLFNWAIDVLGASRTGATMYLQPIFVAGLAWLLLGEAIEPYHIAGAGIILVGVVLVLALRPKLAAAPAR
jgi:drug/metabolite transporter (DMT)-like permease